MTRFEKVAAFLLWALLFVAAVSSPGCGMLPDYESSRAGGSVAASGQPAPVPGVVVHPPDVPHAGAGSGAVMPGDQPVIVNPTAIDYADTAADVVRAVEPAVQRGEVTSRDVDEFGRAAGPILNPLTGGWFSAGVLLVGGLLRDREARRRKRMLEAVNDNPDTPPVAEQVRKLKPKLAVEAEKAATQ